PKPGAEPYQVHRVLLDGGRFAPQRGASPLATTRLLATGSLRTHKKAQVNDPGFLPISQISCFSGCSAR
ncbi:hypothetical protein ACVKS2_004319, partial [Pseudomonas sp. PvP125]